MTQFKKILLAIAAFCSCVLSTTLLGSLDAKADQTHQSASLRFAVSDQHGFPLNESQKHFDCLDKIYAVSKVKNFSKGRHAIEFRWSDPSGDPREHTKYNFYVTDEPEIKLWAWLELSRAKGAAMIQWINPAAGLEEFIGSWEVEVFVDGNAINKAEFEVSC